MVNSTAEQEQEAVLGVYLASSLKIRKNPPLRMEKIGEKGEDLLMKKHEE